MIHDTLHFKLPNGEMTINNAEFFPCSQARFNKLFKIIRECWENDPALIGRELQEYLEDRLNDAKIQRDAFASCYRRYMQNWASYRDIVDDGKLPNGLPLTKEQKKKYIDSRNIAKWEAHDSEVSCKKKMREVEGIEKNLEMLKRVV